VRLKREENPWNSWNRSEEANGTKTGWLGRYYFSVRASTNRHTGSRFTYSTRAGKTGLTKVKNFSDESFESFAME
jgi:hypothetical protein